MNLKVLFRELFVGNVGRMRWQQGRSKRHRKSKVWLEKLMDTQGLYLIIKLYITLAKSFYAKSADEE